MGIGIEGQKMQTIQKNIKQDGCYRRKVNPKAFVIPILTASASSQNRDSKCFRISFSSVSTIDFHHVFIVFKLFALFFDF